MEHYSEILKTHFRVKKAMNNGYSLRAFARDLEILPSQLSKVMQQKQGLSLEAAKRISKRLNLSLQEEEIFLKKVEAWSSRSPKKREAAMEELEEISGSGEKEQLSRESFEVISNWIHFAILELFELEDFEVNAQTVSDFYGVDRVASEEALGNLEKTGLVTNDSGRYSSTGQQFHVESSVPSQAIQMYHHQMIQKAKDAISRQPIHQRELQSVTFAVSSEDLPEVREMVKEFRGKLEDKILKNNKSKNPNTVYALNLQLFSLEENSQ